MKDEDRPTDELIRELKTLRERVARQEFAAPQEAERRLAEERNMLRTLIDTLPDFIYIKDADSRFVIGNVAVARLMGAKSPDDLIGKTDFNFYPHELAEQYFNDERALIQSDEALVHREEPGVDYRTGQHGWKLTTKVPWRDTRGNVIGLIGISRDITALKQAEEALRRAYEESERRVQQRTGELTRANAQLGRTLEFFRATVEQMMETVRRGMSQKELLAYLEQVQHEFSRLK